MNDEHDLDLKTFVERLKEEKCVRVLEKIQLEIKRVEGLAYSRRLKGSVTFSYSKILKLLHEAVGTRNLPANTPPLEGAIIQSLLDTLPAQPDNLQGIEASEN